MRQRFECFLRVQIVSLTKGGILFLVCALLLTQCSLKKEQLPKLSDSLAVPYQTINTSTLYCYSGQRLLWKLTSTYLKKNLSDTSSLLAVPVRMIIYDTVKTNTVKILSDSGNTTKNLEKFFLWGNVYIKNWDGLIIQSESLWWDKLTHKFGSEELVEIKTPNGDILRGKGLDATENFSSWTLHQSVSGSFPNFKQRMDSDSLQSDSLSDDSAGL
ncbi:MAG: LPS export ABC transporter periplasmic protein LptC [Chitinivibrionales bacterium]|nr:LPS export ABC transporter periplasmic protein LptC [Chitinivibrionales bacterium]